MNRLKTPVLCLLLIIASIITGCRTSRKAASQCTVIFEDNSSVYYPQQVYMVNQSDSLSLSVGVPHGQRIATINYDDYTVSAMTGESLSYDYYNITLNHIKYSTVIRLTTDLAYTTVYHAGSGTDNLTITETSPHLRYNTPAYSPEYMEDGMLPVGWNTLPDGSGTHIGFGSRVDHSGIPNLDLYIEYLACSPAEDFKYIITPQGEVTITGFTGSGNIVIPSYIEGYPVTGIAAYAFGDLIIECLALPPTMQSITASAFGNVIIKDLYFYDNLVSFPDNAFEQYQIRDIHINAVNQPVYSGSYFATLADKVDYLYSMKERSKIVLFCGSSARFGYDSVAIETAFPDYKVINMGVYAYSNMLPQARLILNYVKAGDILLSSPELDAIDMQFCGSNSFDCETFCMLEANYDMLTAIDCSEFGKIFDSFTSYNEERSGMTPGSYNESPSDYDEDGNAAITPSYNINGDYILYRGDNAAKKTFGIKRAYYNDSYVHDSDIAGINSVYEAFMEKDVRVFFTYSPRSRISISDDSTRDSITRLDALLRSSLIVPVISPIEDSLMAPVYFYGTDNHLSTNGVAVHTEQIIGYLRQSLEDL